jgi:transaldolase
MNNTLADLSIKLFADGADLNGMRVMYEKEYIKGLTTNPTLMKKSGVTDYRKFAHEVLDFITEKPISFEVFSDDFYEMEKQALEISGWGPNVYVKIPVTNTKKVSSVPIIKKLVNLDVKVNVTAITTVKQVTEVSKVLRLDFPSYVSIFAGRIADTGRDPIPTITQSLEILKLHKSCEIIWASPRELLNIFQANAIGCHVITATNDILDKLKLISYDLEKYSLDTVKMFHDDSISAGFKL